MSETMKVVSSVPRHRNGKIITSIGEIEFNEEGVANVKDTEEARSYFKDNDRFTIDGESEPIVEAKVEGTKVTTTPDSGNVVGSEDSTISTSEGNGPTTTEATPDAAKAANEGTVEAGVGTEGGEETSETKAAAELKATKELIDESYSLKELVEFAKKSNLAHADINGLNKEQLIDFMIEKEIKFI